MSTRTLEELMGEALAEALRWKGRALTARPALQVALTLLEQAQEKLIMCPWCGEFLVCRADCFKLAVIKILRDALPADDLEAGPDV